MSQLLERLDELERRFDGLTTKLSDPELPSNQDAYRETNKALSDLRPTV